MTFITYLIIDLAGLFIMMQQQIFRQPPVQEGTDARVDADDFEAGDLPNDRQRSLRGGDEAVLGIEVHEDIQLVAGLEVARDVAARQENLAQFAAVQVKPGRGFTDDGKFIALTDDCHSPQT